MDPIFKTKAVVIVYWHLALPFGVFWEQQRGVEEVHLHYHSSHLNPPALLSPQLQSFVDQHSQSSQELNSLSICVNTNINI